MGSLADYLADAFREHKPRGWECSTETDLLRPDMQHMLGFCPRTDVVLTRRDGSQRIFIELEVSRADPVANHTKHAVAHGFQPQETTETFVSMMSPAINAGRRRLGAASILTLRRLGMSAFQTLLLPDYEAAGIKTLNQLSRAALSRRQLPITREIERAIAVSRPQLGTKGHRIHFAASLGEVLLNARRWNLEVDENREQLWGRRRVRYFVHDPVSHQFAPSKFCAYLPLPIADVYDLASIRPKTAVAADASPPNRPGYAQRFLMSFPLYTRLDETEKRFDGTRAWRHLVRQLRMDKQSLSRLHPLMPAFERWAERHYESITVGRDPQVLQLPLSYR